MSANVIFNVAVVMGCSLTDDAPYRGQREGRKGEEGDRERGGAEGRREEGEKTSPTSTQSNQPIPLFIPFRIISDGVLESSGAASEN